MGNPQPLHDFRCPAAGGGGIEKTAAERILTAGKHDLPDACGKIPGDGGLLGQIADLRAAKSVPEGDLAVIGRFQGEKRLHKRGFSGAVLADDAEIIPGGKGEIHPLKDTAALVGQREIFAGDESHDYCRASVRTVTFLSIRER